MELKLFVEVTPNLSRKCHLSLKNAKKLGLKKGGDIVLIDPQTKSSYNCYMEPDTESLDFSIKIAKDIIDSFGYQGLEIIVTPSSTHISSQKTTTTPTPPAPSITKSPTASVSPKPAMPPAPILPPTQQPSAPPPLPITPAPIRHSTMPPAPSSVPILHKPTQSTMPTQPSIAPPTNITRVSNSQLAQHGLEEGMPSVDAMAPADPYPNKIDIFNLLSSKPGSMIVKPKISPGSLEGKVVLSQNLVSRLNLFPNALVGWEDPLTRIAGSARLKIGQVTEDQILMDENTAFDTAVEAPQILLYSMEPPIIHVEAVTLEIESKPDMGGFIEINHRNAMSLEVKDREVLAFEDDLTGAFGAGKVRFNPNVPDNKVVIDQELIEASGIGSYEVELKKNVRQIIPLQSLELGVSPITGENIWEIISQARNNIDIIKQWLANYIIFKGIKLRWKRANTAIEVLHTVPDLTGDVLASVSNATSIELKPTGLVTFNAILIIDISRSMMARDVAVTNIGPALEGIKAAMHDKEIQEFLAKFKPGINVPRRMSAAFAAVLFLSEKVGRGFGEKVSIIRFADEAQILPMPGGKLWMDSSSGQKGELEACARTIVDQIANAYGQSTNMGQAMEKANHLLELFTADNPEQPTMIVLLTDGAPTDGRAFMDSIKKISANQNVVLYIIGLGNPNDDEMKKAAALCAGEYFKPEDSGELLVWYSKRARDLSLKIKRDADQK
ncbi:VWA domain-containing protein [Promethearchaeum syntrophicum]|uniref:VWA domain-containing protein n=1 Tax=Promethearchaeum syntrophicum TaxID=2594042 RepID=A0A5B9D9Q0_9ARCH|nr:vWA domain-containing protein [Candidatus Prometheoarchaeum syntrophicum]QEE15939.1 von Willebrand factor type A domain protein [Candidatus Prometheoarchaeum syntrophicum]